MQKQYYTSSPIKGITARELFARTDRRIIQDIVQDQVKTIDASICTAHASGFNHIQYELPTNFDINNMDKIDAQTLIYSEILMVYKKPESEGGRGFDKVYIDIGKKTYLHIYWLNGMDNIERQKRKKYILECAAPIQDGRRTTELP